MNNSFGRWHIIKLSNILFNNTILHFEYVPLGMHTFPSAVDDEATYCVDILFWNNRRILKNNKVLPQDHKT